MRRFLALLLLACVVVACSESKNFTVSGTVKGLKKGTLYLQRIQDTALINLDSIVVDGDPEFEFSLNIEEPEVMYLHLDKVDGSGYDDRILFFAEPGEMNITTSLKNFEGFAAVIGAENQMRWTEFQKMNQKFNDKNLDLIKGSYEAQISGVQEDILKYDDSLQRLLESKYRYTGQFASTHASLEMAPFLMLSQIPDANVTFLDTIYNRFPKKIQRSKYGKQLEKLIEERKAEEQN
ncbi:DUF4369 domain-containing protein [uncultured Dokdonia sp.]|uniref:DUF4369 domain-containing protein n=1 Tax=uncultured Dokdonia sp. TaxID=575653 RepID=UPI0026058897|nr:DUF4369 domain-containing protein [uncultured Dokdonia sp.]